MMSIRTVCITDDTPVFTEYERESLKEGREYRHRPLPEIFDVGLERYFRRFEDVPANFLQTSEDEAKLITISDVADTLSFNGKGCKRHVMLVGPPGIGKSLVARTITKKVSERKNDLGRKWFFTLDFRYYAGDEVFFVPHFLFRKNVMRLDKTDQPDLDSDEYMFALGFGESPLLHFLLDGLDTLRYSFEDTVIEVGLTSYASVSSILYNLLSGKLMPHCKIITTCREFRVRYFPKSIWPHQIVSVGELSDITVRELMFLVYGDKHGKHYYFYWKKRSPELHLLNRTANNLACNMLCVNNSKSYTMPATAPVVALNVVLSMTNPSDGPKEHGLSIIHKMMKIAYVGSLRSKRIFTDEELLMEANLSRKEVESMVCNCVINKTIYTIMRSDLLDGRSAFVDSMVHEFLCALHVTGIPILEYETFLEDKLHTHCFHVVRQMLCGVMFDSYLNKTARKERLIQDDADDMTLRRDLLQKSMAAQFHKLKRWDLLEFFRAVRDCRDGVKKLDFLPKAIDVIDFSHIQLLALDMQAIGSALVDVEIGCLNLSNCEISSHGMDALSTAITASKTTIRTLNMDWNTRWFKCSRGVKALRRMIQVCEIKEICWNHCDIDEKLLLLINLFLGDVPFDILRFEENGSYSLKGYGYLGEFVAKHQVKELYIKAGDMTKEQIEQLAVGEGQMLLALPDGRKLDTEANDFTLRP